MRQIRAILIGLSYSAVAIFIMKLGYNGLKLNLSEKSDNILTVEEIYKSHSNMEGDVVSIRIDSTKYVATDEEGLMVFRLLPFDSINDVWVNYASVHKLFNNDTVFGVFESLEFHYPELLIEDGNYTDIYVVKHFEEPRKWYWNMLLILVPMLFLRAFLQAMFRMFKGEKYDQG